MTLLLFSLLQTLDQDLRPDSSKVHRATSNGEGQSPLREFIAGRFDLWRARQSKKNFGRPHVVSLIQLPGRGQWLYAGAYDSEGCKPHHEGGVWYTLRPRALSSAMNGRVELRFPRSARASYRDAESIHRHLVVESVLPEPYAIEEFPGFLKVRLTKEQLDLIMRTGAATWRTALKAVKGVYLITDRMTGRQYVGKAAGNGGIWERWACYSSTGHGANRDLIALLMREGSDYARHFQFAILEVADSNTGMLELDARESHWKLVLGSRAHGYNAN